MRALSLAFKLWQVDTCGIAAKIPLLKAFSHKPDNPSYVTSLTIYPCQDGIQLACVCISTACHASFAVSPTQPLSLLARGTSHHVCGQTEPWRYKVLERVCCELSSGSLLLSGPQSAQPSASLDLMEKSLNCGGVGGQMESRMRGRKRERQGGGGGKRTKGEEKNLEAPPWRRVSHVHVLLEEQQLPLY